jgi:hypothetical protein
MIFRPCLVAKAIKQRGDHMFLQMSWVIARRAALAALTVLLVSVPAKAQNPDGLLGAMTRQEREAAGLNKLSAEEQRYLEAWLRQRLAVEESTQLSNPTPSPMVASPDAEQSVGAAGSDTSDAAMEAEIERRVAIEVEAAISKAKEDEEAEEAAREAALNEPFEAEIVGPFSGWSGKTVFTLSNGQVWRQRNGSDYRHTAQGQTVAVKKNFMGYWTLTVLSSGRTVGVRRID